MAKIKVSYAKGKRTLTATVVLTKDETEFASDLAENVEETLDGLVADYQYENGLDEAGKREENEEEED